MAELESKSVNKKSKRNPARVNSTDSILTIPSNFKQAESESESEEKSGDDEESRWDDQFKLQLQTISQRLEMLEY